MLEQILEVLRREGALLLRARADSISATEKTSEKDLVTNYDVLVQQHLAESLREILPEAGFLGEEHLDRPAADGDAPVFIIDPIDGTMNFSRGLRRSCISVALAQGNLVQLGAVYDPYLGELFYGTRGGGAFLNGAPIHVSDRPLSHGLVMFGSTPYYRALSDQTFRLGRLLFDRSLDLRRSGSAALDLCSVAAGRAEVFYEFLLSPWDYAGASLILEEAGGVLEAMEGGPASLQTRSSVLAGNPQAFREAKKLIQEAML